MKKIRLLALCMSICLFWGALIGCGEDTYSSDSVTVTEEISKINSEKAREETEAENIERMKRADAIAKAKADAQKVNEDSELVMNDGIGEVKVGSTKRSGITIPTYIYYPDNYNAENTYPMVIMFPGFSTEHDNGTRFNPLAKEFNKRGLMVVMYDNPGYGKSEETNLGYTLTNVKNDAVDVIMYMYENFNIGKVGALGYDVGGRVIMELQVDGMCNFDQIELIAPFCETDEFIHACFGEANWDRLKREAVDNGKVTYGEQEYIKEWFLDWEAKADTLTKDFVKNYKDRPCMLMYSLKDDQVKYTTMTNLQKSLGCAAIVSDEDGHDMGVRDWDSPDSTKRVVKTQSVDFMEGLKD